MLSIKKGLLFIMIVNTAFFLIGCFGSSSETNVSGTGVTLDSGNVSTQGGLLLHEGSDFSLMVPVAWVKKTVNDPDLPTPSRGMIELAASASELKLGILNNLVLLSADIGKQMSSKEYALANDAAKGSPYYSFSQITSKDFAFEDGEKTHLSIFSAQYSQDTPKIQFLQTARVCKTKGFLLTLAIPVVVTDTTKYEDILSSLSCK